MKSYITIRTRKNCVLLNSMQEFIEIEAWLLLTFLISLHNNQVLSIPLSHVKECRWLKKAETDKCKIDRQGWKKALPT